MPLLLASDLIYEMRNVAPLVQLIRKVLPPDGVCLLTDQDRVPAPYFREMLAGRGCRTPRKWCARRTGRPSHQGHPVSHYPLVIAKPQAADQALDIASPGGHHFFNSQPLAEGVPWPSSPARSVGLHFASPIPFPRPG